MNAKLSRLCLFAVGAFLASQVSAAPSYTFTDLGHGSANAINNAGQVAGYSGWNAVLWNGTTATSLLSNRYGWAVAINSAGQAAGYTNDDNGNHPAVWNGTTATNLGIGWGNAINNAGQVAGFSSANGNGDHATVWTMHDNGVTVTDLGYGQANAINDAGQVAGTSWSTNNATVWTMTSDGTTATNLGSNANANAINNVGQVAGTSYGNNGSTATLWTMTGNGITTTILGSGSANAINNSGQVVGFITGTYDFFTDDIPYTAILWDGTTATELNSFLTASEISAGWTLTQANGINDSGSIVGQSYNTKTGANNAFLLTASAVPEPDTYIMLLTGLGLMGFMVRRRKTS